MIIYPAIDLRKGKCVRLRQGDPQAETVFGDDPAQMAAHWVEQGAEWLHVVNLDGALGAKGSHLRALNRSGSSILVQRPGSEEFECISKSAVRRLPINLRCLHAIRQRVDVPIQFGGGLRTMDDISLAFKLGATRVVLGTVAIEKPQLVVDALAQWGADRIVVGLDARGGKIATHGWKQTSEIDLLEMGYRMHAMGVKRVVFTDIGRDGMLSGVNVEATSRLGDTTDLLVIASGGVASIEDIKALKRHEHYNIEGVITGQALYTDAINLREAITIGHGPLVRHSAGIVPYRTTPNGPEFLLLFNLFFEKWQFPRGGLLEHEDEIERAQIEFRDETGLAIAQLHADCRTELNYVARIRDYELQRKVIYFLAESTPGAVRLGNENHCEARWVTRDEAWELLTETGPEQVAVLDQAVGYLRNHSIA